MITDTSQQLDKFLEMHFDLYIAETAQLCAQPSVSATGEGVFECAELVAKLLAQHGCQVQVFPTPGQPIVVGHIDGQSERTLLFYNHYDVQPVEPLELWTHLPFDPVIQAGALYGRGTRDDKGEFIARLAAVDAVRAAYHGKLPCGVTFVVEGEEETGSPHIAQFVHEHLDLLRCHGAIWESGEIDSNGRFTDCLGVRGILYVELTVETMHMDAHSGYAHILPNAAWRLLGALQTLKGPDERIRIPGFYDQIRPPSALDLKLLAALPDYEGWLRIQFGVKEFVRGLTGQALNEAVFEPTCNIAGLTAGYQGDGSKTVIPARASAKVDFRLVPDQDPEDILAKLRAHLNHEGYGDVTITSLGPMWPYKAQADDPLISLAAHTAEEVYGQPALLEPLAGGSTPIYAFAGPLGGIPVINPGVGYWDNRAHAPDEHVRLTDFLNGARHIARILAGFAGL